MHLFSAPLQSSLRPVKNERGASLNLGSVFSLTNPSNHFNSMHSSSCRTTSCVAYGKSFPLSSSHSNIYIKAKWWLLRLVDCSFWWGICLILLHSLKTEQKCLLSLEVLQLTPWDGIKCFPLCLLWDSARTASDQWLLFCIIFCSPSSVQREPLIFLWVWTWPNKRLHFLAFPTSMCDHVTKLQLIRDIRDGLCGSFWEPSLRKQLMWIICLFVLSSILLPGTWMWWLVL